MTQATLVASPIYGAWMSAEAHDDAFWAGVIGQYGERAVHEWRAAERAQHERCVADTRLIRRYRRRVMVRMRIEDARAVKHILPAACARHNARSRGAGRPRAQATRSSARSGDGPSASDSDPHELDVASHRLAPRRAVLTFGLVRA